MKGWPILYRFPAASSHRWFPTSDQQLDDMVRFQRKPGSRRWSPASVGRRGSSGDFVTLPRSHSRWTAQGAPEPTLHRGTSGVPRWQQAQQLEEVSSGVLHGLGIFEGCRCVFFFLWLGSSPNVAVLGAKSRLKSRLCLKHEDFGWCFLFICGADVFGGLELCLRDSQNPKHQASLGRSRCKVWRPKNIYPKPCIPSVLPPLFFWYFPHSLPLQSHSFSMFFQLLRFGVFTSGVVSAIGVSNFLKRHLEELRRDLKGHALAGAVGGAPPGLKTWPPDVVQHEVHLLRREEELLRYCRLWNITAT